MVVTSDYLGKGGLTIKGKNRDRKRRHVSNVMKIMPPVYPTELNIHIAFWEKENMGFNPFFLEIGDLFYSDKMA